MKKIITLFARNYETDRLVRDEIVPGTEWVSAGEGIATRKLDGTACLVKDGKPYKRYEWKPGRNLPDGFCAAQEPDSETGEIPGWVPVGAGKEDKWHRQAFPGGLPDWTYELCGPKVNGNPEGYPEHVLVPHGSIIPRSDAYIPRDFAGLRSYFEANDVEGIVWWRDLTDQNCDKVKIKAKDFGLRRGPRDKRGD